MDLSPADDVLKVEDTAKEHKDLELDAGSISVEKETEGLWSTLRLSDTVSSDTYKQEVDAPNGQITLYVPDNTHLKVRYEYSLLETGAPTVTIENNVTVAGKAAITNGTKREFDTTEIRGSVRGSGATINLKKVRKDTQDAVPGAKFILYVPNIGNLDNSEAAEIGKPVLTTGANKKLYPAAVYETDDQGEAKIDWTLLKNNVTYGLA